jgi:PAS domain S-box-containing protein
MIFEYIGDGIFITDQDGFIVLASRSAARLAGCSHDEIIGLDITGFHSEEGLVSWQKATAETDGEAHTYEDALPQTGGASVPVEWTVATFTVASETYSIGVARDLTDRRQADERRMEAERLKTLLEIAGGAAHEINQPLTAILGYAEMSMDLLEPDHPTREYQDHVAAAALRINEILKRMQAVKGYRTRPYADGHQIVDFERSAETKEGDD